MHLNILHPDPVSLSDYIYSINIIRQKIFNKFWDSVYLVVVEGQFPGGVCPSHCFVDVLARRRPLPGVSPMA